MKKVFNNFNNSGNTNSEYILGIFLSIIIIGTILYFSLKINPTQSIDYINDNKIYNLKLEDKGTFQ